MILRRVGALRTLRGRITLLVGISALFVAAGVALLLLNTVRLRDDANSTIRSNIYLRDTQSVLQYVLDAETGLRGYALTGNTLFLAPTQTAITQLPHAEQTLIREARRNGQLIDLATALNLAARQYIADYVKPLIVEERAVTSHTETFSQVLAGKRRVDHIRLLAGTLETDVNSRARSRAQSVHHTSSRSIIEAIAVLVLLSLITGAVGTLLGRLAIGRELAREESERTAQILQQSLLPPTLPELPGCEVAVRFAPAGTGELIGGDFYDVFGIGPGQWAFVIGDVQGKGPAAAALTGMARWTLRSLAQSRATPEESLTFLNRVILQQGFGNRTLTLAYGHLEIGREGAVVRIAAAGHPPPILMGADGASRELAVRGTLLGVTDDVRFTTCEQPLAIGDTLLAYTDGLTDQGVTSPPPPIETLAGVSGTTELEQVLDTLQAAAVDPSRAQRDDIAIVALRYVGQALV